MNVLNLICSIIAIAISTLVFFKISKIEKDNNESVEKILSHLEEFKNYQTDGENKLKDEISSKLVILTKGLHEEQTNLRKDVLDSFKILGDTLRSEQSTQRNMLDSQIKQTNQSKHETQEALDKIRDENNKSLDKINNTLHNEQSKQQEMLKEQLESVEKQLEQTKRDTQEALDKIRNENNKNLDKINDTVNEKLQETLNDRISKSFETVNNRLAEVYKGLGEMKNVASGVSDLKNVLSNVKTRGILGEIQLSAILSEILAPQQYDEQVAVIPNSKERVDFAVKLPGLKEGESIYLPIDSKFPGDRYSNLLTAYESGDKEEINKKRKALETEIKNCAKSIHDKYIKTPYTTNFAIMFLPFEGLYAEVVNNINIVEDLQKLYHINITGPSTMAAMLNSLQMGFRTLAIQKRSGEVWKVLEAAKKEFSNFEKVLTKARDRLRQADEELDSLVGTRTRAINRELKDVTDENVDIKLIEK